jgi:hypothetical protein
MASWVTPGHTAIQKVRSEVFGLTELQMRISLKNMLLILGVVKEIMGLSCGPYRE